MDIIKHPACDSEIGPPADMQDGSCSTLPILRHRDEHGQWAISFWKPSADDLAVMNAGGGIALHVRAGGRQHPVVGMSTFEAFEQPTAGG